MEHSPQEAAPSPDWLEGMGGVRWHLCHAQGMGRPRRTRRFETNSPSGRVEGLTLRTFNPKTQQWFLTWVNSKDGLITPPQVGSFKNGQGEFYGQDTLNGKVIYVRFIWSKTNTNRPHFEQAF